MRRQGAQALAWRARFVADRLDELLDAQRPRPGPPHTIDDSCLDAMIAKTLWLVAAGAGPSPHLMIEMSRLSRRVDLRSALGQKRFAVVPLQLSFEAARDVPKFSDGTIRWVLRI